jgi:predicted N-acetyltransferase YhbS
MVSRMRGGQRNAVPLGLASFEGFEPTGTVSLLEQDLGRSSELTPWVAGLYVRPEFRKKGIGASLVNAVVAEAHGMGYGALYLYTEIPHFYEKLKWRIHSKVQDDDGVFIMSRVLTN